jgi:septal ring factor EnvC (AmiA/AmiB activator)
MAAPAGRSIMTVEIHHHYHFARDSEAERSFRVAILRALEALMIDTSKILAAVAEERSENASLRKLAAEQNKILADTAAQLKAAGVDAAALAQVQADLDQAAAELSTDNAATKDAIAANATPAAAPAAPAA